MLPITEAKLENKSSSEQDAELSDQEPTTENRPLEPLSEEPVLTKRDPESAQPRYSPTTTARAQAAPTSLVQLEEKSAGNENLEGLSEVFKVSEHGSRGVSEVEDSEGGETNAALAAAQQATVTVKILLMPDEQVMTMAFTTGLSVLSLKEHFATELKIPSSVIQIMSSGSIVQDSETLMDLGVRPLGTIELQMSSTDPENFPIKPLKNQQEDSMPDVITVRVQMSTDTYQDVVVEIERFTHRKPFLGGYRHKITGVEFHHAAVQTVPKRRPDNGIEKFCRDTQTVKEKTQYQQTNNTTSTQMTKIGCYVSNMTDKFVSPGKYVTSEEYNTKRTNAAIVIQTYTRRWLATRYVEELRRQKTLWLEWEEQEAVRKKLEKENRLKSEYERRVNAKTKEDFALLYTALEKWRKEETDRINATLTGAERKAALCALLDQEAQLIASIGRHKLNADEENNKKSVQAFLDKCAESKKWKSFDGKMVEMDTQYTIRARELRDIYTSVNMKYLTQDERLDVLLTLKHTVKEHDCKLTQEIVELIDREADLLMRGIKESSLEGLRKRISTLFLQYIKTPTFNPEVTRLLKVPQDPTKLRKNIYFCLGCRNYLPSTEFSMTTKSHTIGRCRHCNKLDNEARRREDFSKYKNMLKYLRKAETEYSRKGKIAFLVQEEDLQYLIETIWGAQSALSAADDLADLVMVRWDRYFEWSPWNCVLLTKEEAAAHLTIDNVDEAYGVVFIRKIKQRHILAKKYFSRITSMTQNLTDLDSKDSSSAKDANVATILNAVPGASAVS
ncbi:IQ and ubiquitin-like domain-containing protein [Erpetoichthys calabaricus]|uniref:IQ and ubiquitin-like domain-containing protein n=1 Tax=Erpetoichthys calabaricus TaxID=27687 RepID=UPI002234C173|nr:IQ and ubiquitin-like domain-containing protein [Erpetoichthys calabaricus]